MGFRHSVIMSPLRLSMCVGLVLVCGVMGARPNFEVGATLGTEYSDPGILQATRDMVPAQNLAQLGARNKSNTACPFCEPDCDSNLHCCCGQCLTSTQYNNLRTRGDCGIKDELDGKTIPVKLPEEK